MSKHPHTVDIKNDMFDAHNSSKAAEFLLPYRVLQLTQCLFKNDPLMRHQSRVQKQQEQTGKGTAQTK